jgi:hypothetical protein
MCFFIPVSDMPKGSASSLIVALPERRNGKCRGAWPVGPVEDLGHQCEARRRIVACGCDLRFSPSLRGCPWSLIAES